ncbi:DUF2780 domain-containing protein [Vibrio makurazakiensis]|uniref:DUF2780 domain-containing protein n=1 Tax=Vibrio makurazakiensis TaxID=2910250 RepID=UPI003D0AFAE5
MKKVIITVLSSLAVVSCASTNDSSQESASTSTTNYSQLTQTALTTAINIWTQQNQSTPVADSIAEQTSVTTEQALGGAGSLFALAQNSLSSSNSQELATLVPGLDTLQQTGLTSMLSSKGAVESAFSGLGMDASMISTFAPIIIQALQSQGASNSLLSSLGTIWQ